MGIKLWICILSAAALTSGCFAPAQIDLVRGSKHASQFDSSGGDEAPRPQIAIPPGNRKSVPAGTDLQAAIDRAQPGDTLVLDAGAVYRGTFTLRNKASTSTDPITITTSGWARLPGPDSRVIPGSDAVNLARLTAANGVPVVQTEAGAHGYQLIGLEIFAENPNADSGDTVLLGSISAAVQPNDAAIPFAMSIDRCYIHGWPGHNFKRGIGLHSNNTEIINSYIADFHSNFQDSQAIFGAGGRGPYRIENNYLEGSGENIIFGGAPAAYAGVIPSDILVRRNHFFKPLSWRNWRTDAARWNQVCKPIVDNPSLPDNPECARRVYGSYPSNYVPNKVLITVGAYTPVVKNLFEVKIGQRVVLEENVMENNWAQADQHGMPIVLTRRSDSGCWTKVGDITVTRNILRNVAGVVGILGRDDACEPGDSSENFYFAQNVFSGISANAAYDNLRLIQMTGANSAVFEKNHFIVSQGTPIVINTYLTDLTPTPMSGFVFRCNITTAGYFNLGAPLANPVLQSNLIVSGAKGSVPGTNFYPADLASVGFVNPATDDFRLRPDSPYTTACDGAAAGADVEAVNLATAQVIAGNR